MEEQSNTNEIKIARSSEERIAGMLLDALESFDKYMDIALGIEEYNNTGKSMSNSDIAWRRVYALIKSVNCLKQIIRKSRPTISQLVDLNSTDNDAAKLNAIRMDCDDIIKKKESAEVSKTKDDDLIWEKIIPDGNYSRTIYKLSPNFWKLVRELEELYEETYSIILKNGLLTKKTKEIEGRRKQHEIF